MITSNQMEVIIAEAEGLPEIKAYWAVGIGFQNAVAGYAATLHDETLAGTASLSTSAKSKTRGFDFSAHSYNPIYGNCSHVRPIAMGITYWRRFQ